MTRDITFTGSGEMDNGMTISYFQLLSAGAFSSSGLALDMGDAGTLSFRNGGSGGHGIGAYEDKMPTAAEQVWDDLDGQANGVVTKNATNKIGYGTSFGGANVSANYNKHNIWWIRKINCNRYVSNGWFNGICSNLTNMLELTHY